MSYDSTAETRDHIIRVRELLGQVSRDLTLRSIQHDQTKLVEPEKSVFDEFTPQLRALEYDSPEYRAALKAMGPALEHHYAHNRHHPEYHDGGIHDMTLVDLIEMLADWKAAGERHRDGGDLGRSIRQNAERFDYGASMISLLQNTARSLGWL